MIIILLFYLCIESQMFLRFTGDGHLLVTRSSAGSCHCSFTDRPISNARCNQYGKSLPALYEGNLIKPDFLTINLARFLK